MGIETSDNPLIGLKDRLFRNIERRFKITPDNLSEYIYPLVQYIHEIQPHYIVALDCGARITGVGVHMMYSRLYGALPTKDHSIHFRKFSHFSTNATNTESLKPFIGILSNHDSPLIFVIDDWINTGMTHRAIRDIFSDLSHGKMRVHFGVMRELFSGIADVSGAKYCIARTTWRDNEDIIGIKYDGLHPYALASEEARRLRRQIATNIDAFVLDKFRK